MASFEPSIQRIDSIEPIEGADRIELAVIRDYRSVISKGSFAVGDMVENYRSRNWSSNT